MRLDMEKYSQQLRQIVDDYFHGQLTLPEYVAQRKLVLDHIEEGLKSSSGIEMQREDALDQ
ncbi:MAG: hypothetical protein ACLGHO_13895 [Gammaproteobacteria bacterium]